MKKILAILCGVTMMFAACTPNEEGAGVVPTFPEEQNYEILSGRGQNLQFTAEHDWTLSVDYDFAYLKDAEGNNVKSVSGVAGENLEVMVAVESAIENYDNDIVFHVNMEMEGHTSVLATLTIKKLVYAVQEYEIESGKMRKLEFRATEAWTVSMEENDNAWLEYDGEKNYSFSGTATNELVSIWVKTEAGINNYDNDIVFSVNRKMGSADAQEWAKFTIKKIERPEAIKASLLEGTMASFGKVGYPTWTDFNAQHTYVLSYADQWGSDDVSLSCNLAGDYNIEVWANNAGYNLVKVGEEEESWLSVNVFNSTGGFKVLMDTAHSTAEYSWNEMQQFYEGFVNFVDSEGNVLASIYCTSTYKPGNTGGNTGGDAKVTFVNPNVAPQVGMSLTNVGDVYTLTLNSWEVLDANYASMCGIYLADAAPNRIVSDNQFQGILQVAECEGGYYHVQFTDAAIGEFNAGTLGPMSIPRNYEAKVYNETWMSFYTLKIELGWIMEVSGEAVALADAEQAAQAGVTLTLMETTDPDYDSEFGLDYGVTNAPQYRLTYSKRDALTDLSKAVLNIANFGSATCVERYTINGETYYGTQIISVWNNTDFGGVVIEPATDFGFTAETIPAGKYPITVSNNQWMPMALILLEITAE